MARNANNTHIRDVAEIMPDQANFGQVSVGTGASVLLLAARTGRSVALITNADSTNPIYIGTTAGVTSSTGHPLKAGLSLSVSYTGALYAISTGGTVVTGASEIYDLT